MKPITMISAILCISLLLNACGPRSPQDKLEKAGEKAQTGDIDGAVEDVLEIKKMDLDEQTWAQATMFLGSLYVQRMEIDAARAQFTELKKRFGVQNPNPMLEQIGQTATINIIQSYAQTGQIEKAMNELMETSSTLKNGAVFSKTLHMVKGDLLATEGKTDEAVNTIMEMIPQESDPTTILDMLMRAADYHASKGQEEEAAQVYLDYLHANPNFELDLDLYVLAGINLASIPDPDESIKTKRRNLMEQALARFEEELQGPSSERERLLLGKATALRLLERNTEALDLLTSISQTQSFQPLIRASAMMDIGRHYQGVGEFGKAREYYQKLATDYPDFADRAGFALQMLARQEAELAIRGSATQPTSAPASQPTEDLSPTTAPVAE